jgi:DNA polymerase-4
MKIFADFTPLVEPLSLDEAFLDVTGARRLLGTAREIGTEIRRKIFEQEGITCSVGIAPSKFIAKLASGHCKPNGLLEIAPDRILTFLHPLPVSALWGVGPKTAETLEQLGLRTVEDVAKLPRATLIRAVGQATGETLHELAWGRDFRDVTPEDVDKSISAAETFAQDLDNPEEILQEFLRLTQKATARLREKELFAKTISIKVRFADFTTINRSKTLPLATDSAHETYEAVKDLYAALRIERARLRLVGVSLENLVTAAPEQMVLGARDKGWRDAERAIDSARARFGRSSVRPGRLVENNPEDE